MASPNSNDRSLLDRLNALKPTSASALTHAGPTSAEGRKQPPPLSREDALAERLRVLRNNSQPANQKPSNSNRTASSFSSGSGTLLAQPQSPATHLGDEIPNKQSLQKSPSSVEQSKTEKPNRSFYEAEKNPDNEDDYTHLLESGVDPDQTLDELLDGLDEDFDLDDGYDPPSFLSEFDPAKESKKVSDLLEKMQKENISGEQPPAPPRSGGGPYDKNDDDSESEQMTRDVEDIISRIRDELGVGMEKEVEAGESGGGEEEGNSASESPPDTTTAAAAADTSSFSLPDAPASPLRDINPPAAGEATTQEGDDDSFENDIVTRMASLKGITTDAFGLPVAPTFSPQDHHHTKKVTTTPKGVGGGRVGYTNQDQKTWCIVCLDDATIKCIGCDSDVYCGRCWRDMHVGPRAGYDERGHQWVKFVR
ncbi:hypothetical protein QBC37DRAFT_275203 [Rhypophila decipiens]|uniref:Abscission/NoCut checkpoint regulator n=1 Tax=Rhypophila decipiens TaxID=261697 RepID=A0AAN6YGY6_9PEZI|nr:hypothetical protein QBC37DRAFT_275203 [Rhypophila decipiens]